MLVDEAVLKKLDSSYKKEILKLEAKYAAIKYKKFPRIKQLLFEFSQNYLMLPKYWDELFEASHKVIITLYKSPSLRYFNGHDESVRGRMRSRKHFFSNDVLQRTEHGFKKLLHESPKLYQEFVEYNEIKKELCLPRKDLDKTWRYFKEYSSSPLPQEALLLYEETEKLYEKIISAKNDVKKWFKLICQVKDDEYICNNVEYRIGNDMTNKELWKLYIKYLQKIDTKRLLYIYSCYCRFFLDDENMKEEYKKACKKFGPSIVHWKNAFDFEVFKEEELSDEIIKKKKKEDEDEEKDRYLVSDRDDNTTNRRVCEQHLTEDQKIKCTNAKNQIFSLPKTIISYIIKQENFNVFIKLQQTCKYFFSILPYSICYNVFVTRTNATTNVPYYIEFYKQSTWISYNGREKFSSVELNLDRRLIISNTFHCIHTTEDTILSKFIPNIFQCNVKHLRIHGQNLTFKEFKFLAEHGNVETLHLTNINLANEKSENVKLQEILSLTPKIVEFKISRPYIDERTFETLAHFNFVNKFKIFRLITITYFEPYGLAEFLKKTLDSKSEFFAKYQYQTDRAIAQNSINIVKNELKQHWSENEAPQIEISHPLLQ